MARRSCPAPLAPANPSTLYVGEASYEPFDEPSGWEYRGLAEAVGGGTSIQTTLPEGLTSGDTLVLTTSMEGDQTGTLGTPSGWTRHHIDYEPAAGTYAVYTKPYVAESTPAPRLTWGGADLGTTWSLGAWRGGDPASPVDTYAAASSPIPSTLATTPAITTTVDGALLVWDAVDFWGWGPTTPPTGFRQRGWTLSDRVAGASGAIPALTGTMPFSEGWYASILALRPRDW